MCCPFYGMHCSSGRVPAYFIPPSPLAGPLFPENTKKGHCNSRVVLKPQRKFSSVLLWDSSGSRGRAGVQCFLSCFFFLSRARMDLFLFCDGLHEDSQPFLLYFHSCCSSEHSRSKQLWKSRNKQLCVPCRESASRQSRQKITEPSPPLLRPGMSTTYYPWLVWATNGPMYTY